MSPLLIVLIIAVGIIAYVYAISPKRCESCGGPIDPPPGNVYADLNLCSRCGSFAPLPPLPPPGGSP